MHKEEYEHIEIVALAFSLDRVVECRTVDGPKKTLEKDKLPFMNSGPTT